MSAVAHDPDTGRFVRIPFREKYPTGRKHCSDCKCWRHVSDFTVHSWLDVAKTIPSKLLACCRACAAQRRRQRSGYKRRNWYRTGIPGTETWKLRRLAQKRERYLILRKDPEWVAQRRAYQRQYGVPDPEIFKWGNGMGQYRASHFVAYMEHFLRGQTPLAIGDTRLSLSETKALRRWRSGEVLTIRLATADAWCIRFGLPLWEIDELAGRMAP